MPFRRPSFLIAVPAVLCVAAPAFAHHQFGVEFDANKRTNLKGTLTGIDWENPHACFHMDVTDSGGKAQSRSLEMITPNALSEKCLVRQNVERGLTPDKLHF